MNEAYEFKNEIIKYSLFIALICEVLFIIIKGFDMHFAYGLMLGTAVAIVNFNISYLVIYRFIGNRKSAIINFFGYLIRLSIYGYAFYQSIQIGRLAAIGAVTGFLTIKMSIYYISVIKTIRIKNKGN